MDIHFDKTYVINLPRRFDRMKRFIDGVEAVKNWPFEYPVRYIAYDGLTTDVPAHIAATTLGPGGFGLLVTTAMLLNQVYSEGCESVMLFEDDCVFCDDFGDKAFIFMQKVPDDWDMVYFGGCLRQPRNNPPVVVNDLVIRPYMATATHCVAIKRTIIPEILKRIWWLPYEMPDALMARLHAEAYKGEADWNIYLARWRLAGQHGNVLSDITFRMLNQDPDNEPPRFWQGNFLDPKRREDEWAKQSDAYEPYIG
jgi:hypothetical protein